MKKKHNDRMRRGPKGALFVAALVVAALLVGRFLFPSGGDPDTDPAEQVEIDVRPRLTATRVVGRRQGERQFELDAGSIGDDGDWVLLEEIENGLLYRDGEVFVAFEANAGRWHRPSNNLVLSGDVVLHYDERVNIHTEQLEWRASTELVVAPESVQLMIDGDFVTAASMEADLHEEWVRLQGDVRITRASGDRVQMATVVYWLEDERLEGFGQGRLVFGENARH